jgi:hypothetical protein
MINEFLLVVLHTLGAVVAAAILFFGIPFAIFLGEANARGQPLVSRGFDRLAALVFYLSWFGLLWQFGFSRLLLMAACGAAVALCTVYAVSYQTAARRLRRRPASEPCDERGRGERREGLRPDAAASGRGAQEG